MVGWRNAPFYWPVFVVQQQVNAGIFTINGNKKFRAPRKQVKINPPAPFTEQDILRLPIRREYLFDILTGVKTEEYRDIKRTTCSLYLEKDLLGNYILVDGTDPNKYYDLGTYNDGVFPFEVKQVKALYLRASQDYSGSQAIVSLNPDNPFELEPDRMDQMDVVYSDQNTGRDITDDNTCIWMIKFNLDGVIKAKLTPEDEELFEQYKANLQNEEQE